MILVSYFSFATSMNIECCLTLPILITIFRWYSCIPNCHELNIPLCRTTVKSCRAETRRGISWLRLSKLRRQIFLEEGSVVTVVAAPSWSLDSKCVPLNSLNMVESTSSCYRFVPQLVSAWTSFFSSQLFRTVESLDYLHF